MKKYQCTLFVLSTTVLLFSCQTQQKTDQSDKTNEPVTLDTIYQGGGNEPGWHVVLTKNLSGEIEYDLTLDYGVRQTSGMAEMLAGTNPNKSAHYILHDEKKPLVLNITYELCVDDGDQRFDTRVTLSDNNFVLKGCGSFD